jgi:16S rRNA (uracil1498-N3)-methyltransferase
MVGRGGTAGVITVLIAGAAAAGDTIELDAEELHHLRVRRAAETRVHVRNGAGLVGEGLLFASGHRMLLAVELAHSVDAPPPLVLAVGAGDRERFGLLVEKSAELGVTRVVPLTTARAKSVAGRVRDDQLRRLRRRALETLKQSGAAWAPHVADAVSLEWFLQEQNDQATEEAPGVRWLADADGAAPPPALPASGSATVLIGPEGGFTPQERSAALASGYLPVGFGSHVLRFETAAMAAAVTINVARRRGAE